MADNDPITGVSSDDIDAFLGYDPDEDKSQTAARLSALRGQTRRGMAGMLMDDPIMNKFGSKLVDNARQTASDQMRYGPENRLLKLSLGKLGLLGKTIPANISAEAKKYGVDANSDNVMEQIAAKKQIAAQHEEAATRRTAMTVYGGDKADQGLEKMFNDLSPYKNPKLNVLQQNIDRGDAVDQLFQQGPQGLTQIQQAEAAQGLVRLIGGSGRIAQQQIEHMIPHTLWQDAQKLWEYISNNPVVLKNQAFNEIMKATLNRERALSQQKIRDEQERALSAHAHTIRSKPTDAARVAAKFGLLIPDEYYGDGAQQPPVAPQLPPAAAPGPAAPPPAAPPPRRALPGVVPPPAAPPPGGGAPRGPVPVRSKAEYDALPPGTKYVGPDGQVATKKAR